MGSRSAWARDFLITLGNSNPDDRTIALVSAWTAGEGTPAVYNPLATTLEYGEFTCFNYHEGRCHVKNYKTRAQGIQAAVLTLRGNFAGYDDIVAGLSANDPEKALYGMHSSPWGTNFGTVESTWRTSNVNDQLLLSEPEEEGSGSIPPVPIGDAHATPPDTSISAPTDIFQVEQVRTILRYIVGGIMFWGGFILFLFASRSVEKAASVASVVIPQARAAKVLTNVARLKGKL